MIELSSVTMQEQGRIEPILSMAPEEAKSQPLVMVNVYTRGVLSGISLQPRKRELVCQKDLCLKVACGTPGLYGSAQVLIVLLHWLML